MVSQSSGDVLLRSLRKAGPLPAGKAVVGRILSVTERSLAAVQAAASQRNPMNALPESSQTGEGKFSKGKGRKGEK